MTDDGAFQCYDWIVVLQSMLHLGRQLQLQLVGLYSSTRSCQRQQACQEVERGSLPVFNYRGWKGGMVLLWV
jgi:hypothetical protein